MPPDHVTTQHCSTTAVGSFFFFLSFPLCFWSSLHKHAFLSNHARVFLFILQRLLRFLRFVHESSLSFDMFFDGALNLSKPRGMDWIREVFRIFARSSSQMEGFYHRSGDESGEESRKALRSEDLGDFDASSQPQGSDSSHLFSTSFDCVFFFFFLQS